MFSTGFVVAVLPYCLLYIFQCCHLPPSVAQGTIIFCSSSVATAIHLCALPRGVRSMTRMSDVCEVRTAQGMWHTSCLTITLCWLRNKIHSWKDTVCVAYCRPVDLICINLYRNADIHHGGPAKVSRSVFGVIEYVNVRIVCSCICSVVSETRWLSEFVHEV